jgi:hypothetical protein
MDTKKDGFSLSETRHDDQFYGDWSSAGVDNASGSTNCHWYDCQQIKWKPQVAAELILCFPSPSDIAANSKSIGYDESLSPSESNPYGDEPYGEYEARDAPHRLGPQKC